VAAWWLGRIAFDERVAAGAAAVLLWDHALTLRNVELIGDIPAAACLIAGIALIVRELERDDGPSWWFVGVAPAFAAAFYLRYGHAPKIAIAGVAAAALWWRRIVARPLPVVAAVIVLAGLLAPHVVGSLEATGSPLGI